MQGVDDTDKRHDGEYPAKDNAELVGRAKNKELPRKPCTSSGFLGTLRKTASTARTGIAMRYACWTFLAGKE